MIVYREYVEDVAFEFAERAELSIDAKIPYPIFSRFSDFEVNIDEVSSENKKLCFLILFLESALLEIIESLWCYENLADIYHTLVVDKGTSSKSLRLLIGCSRFGRESIYLSDSELYGLIILEHDGVVFPVFRDDYRFTGDCIHESTKIVLCLDRSNNFHKPGGLK